MRCGASARSQAGPRIACGATGLDWWTGWCGQHNEIDITNHIGYMPARNGCGGRSALRFSPPLDGRCSLVASATPPTDSGSGSDRRPRLRRGSSVLRGLTGRTRVRPVAARCRRAEWTVSCDSPSVVRNDDRAATLVWFEHNRTGCRPLLRFPWRYLAVAGGGFGVA